MWTTKHRLRWLWPIISVPRAVRPMVLDKTHYHAKRPTRQCWTAIDGRLFKKLHLLRNLLIKAVRKINSRSLVGSEQCLMSYGLSGTRARKPFELLHEASLIPSIGKKENIIVCHKSYICEHSRGINVTLHTPWRWGEVTTMNAS